MISSRPNRYGKSTLFAIVLILAPVLTATMSPAQETTRSLTGTVTDRSHEPLRGAVVQLEDESTHSVVSYITSRTGQYSFKRISGDRDYMVWATYRGVTSRKQSLDKFSSKHAPKINLTIELQ